MSRAEGADIQMIHRNYRDCRYPDETTALLAAQIAIANVAKAYSGILSKTIILKAVKDAKTPNAVSLAIRTGLK